ncbi:MAG: competence/damage-inducible protein A [Actinomycetes bacterium]|jgi:nicotinamide-nucleotide amidase|nr:competence/damage-inducible protein A [Acidimicrobiia bacterium]
MIIEVIAVGTELLLGQIVNGNAAFIGSALAENGFDAHYQQVVGDNLGRVADAIGLALSRADAVIITGGLGPTRDDLTREAICAATGREMRHSDTYEEALRERFARLGREIPASNFRQADYPDGAEMLPNPKGTAPGLALEHAGKWIFAIPGVPEEMEHLLVEEVLPRLRRAAGLEGALVNRVLRTWGRPESWVGERLDDLFESSNPSIAFLASGGEIKVRITAKAASEAEALAAIAPMEEEVRRRLGPAVFAVDSETIESVLFALLEEKGWTIGSAESMTAGLVAARLTALPGASKYFRGGIVAYVDDLKRDLLGVDVSHGVVNERVAVEMARGARSRLAVDVAIAVTGSAGPEPMEQPAGTVVIGVATPEDAAARTLTFAGDRERVRTYSTTAALQLARLAMTGAWWRRG